MSLYLLICFCIFFLFFCFVIFKLLQKQKILSQKLQQEEQKLILISLELSQKEIALTENKHNFQLQKEELKKEYAQNLQALEEKYTQNLTSLKQEFQTQSTLHTQTLLAQNKNLLNEDSKKILDEIFKPIKEQVKDYSQRLIQNETSIQTSLKYV